MSYNIIIIPDNYVHIQNINDISIEQLLKQLELEVPATSN